MNWIGDRVSYKDHEKGFTTFVITPKREKWKDILLIFWTFLWTLIGVAILYELFQGAYDRQSKIALIVFLSFWVYFEIRVLKALLWLVYGKEFIKVNHEYLNIKKSIGKYGKSKQFLIDNVKNIQLINKRERSLNFQFENSYWVVGGERVLFDYLGKSYHFGRKLDDKDASLLAKVFDKRVKKYKKATRQTSE